MKTIIAIILAVSAFAQRPAVPPPILGPYSSAINIAIDLAGVPDAAPLWGNSASYASQAQFNPPAGYRTRILRVYGDFIAWPKAGGVIAKGTSCEVGWGLKTTAPDGSALITYPGYTATPNDNSFVWVQNVVDSNNSSPRLSYDFDVQTGGLLGTDNILLIQSFVALNTTGLTIHMEPTFVVVFQFEREAGL